MLQAPGEGGGMVKFMLRVAWFPRSKSGELEKKMLCFWKRLSSIIETQKICTETRNLITREKSTNLGKSLGYIFVAMQPNLA